MQTAVLSFADLSCLDVICEPTKFDPGIESILKKDLRYTTSGHMRSSSGDRTRRRRRKDIDDITDHDGGLRRSDACASSRRVLFKNNVSVYRFDTEPASSQNCAVDFDPSRRPTTEVGPVRSYRDAITRPPTSSRSSGSELGDRRRVKDDELTSSSRRRVSSPSLSPVVVGDFEVIIVINIIIILSPCIDLKQKNSTNFVTNMATGCQRSQQLTKLAGCKTDLTLSHKGICYSVCSCLCQRFGRTIVSEV